MSEYQAKLIAERWLNQADRFGSRDPDGDECIVARQYLRTLEQVETLIAEIERLRHDIERHVKVAADQQQEVERLRAINRRAKQLADEHAKEVVRLRAALGRITEIDGLPDDPGPCGHIAIAALALTKEKSDWIQAENETVGENKDAVIRRLTRERDEALALLTRERGEAFAVIEELRSERDPLRKEIAHLTRERDEARSMLSNHCSYRSLHGGCHFPDCDCPRDKP